MDFSKLDQNEKLAVYGSIVVVLAGLISTYGGLMWLAVLAAIGMLVVVFLPQFSAGTNLPGSKGTLMATLGLVAVAAGVITLLQWMSVLGALFGSFGTIMLLVAVIGTAVMAWAGWQELQGEGGQWRFGSDTTARSSASASSTTAAPSETAIPPTATTAAPPPASPPAEVEAMPPASSSYDTDAEDDRPRDA
jgi:hypothetical protein